MIGIITTFKTDSDEDVILVSEKSGTKVCKVPLHLAKLQILQRDIDQESLPKLPSTSYLSTSFHFERQKSIPAKEIIGEMKIKIKEETNEKDNVKKVKKTKKEKTSKTENATKMCKDKKLVDISDNNEIKKKRKKSSDSANDVINISDSDAETPKGEGVSKKKKKKKRLEVEDEAQTESVQSVVKDETKKPQKKKEKKAKIKSLQTKSNVEIVKIENNENSDTDTLPNKKKKSKKAKKQSIVVATEDTEEKKSKKKKTKQSAKEEVDISGQEAVTTKKSKKIKSKPPINGVNVDELIVIEDKDIKNKVDHLKYEEDECKEKDFNQIQKKKHKKAKSESVLDVKSKKNKKVQDFVDVTNNPEPKKKKISKESDKEPLLQTFNVEEKTTNAGKQKKRSKKVESDVDETKKKRKIKKEPADHEFPDSSQVEVVFLSEKAGNTDEVNINQERRQALQMEIDEASQPKKPANPSGLGQWSTAEFGSSEQQQKFLRLMGGFKKGFQPASSNTGNANMALGKNAQQQLQQGLQGEFERAHSRHMDFNNRGTGLGFTELSKKFSIDVNATRSIRFDD